MERHIPERARVEREAGRMPRFLSARSQMEALDRRERDPDLPHWPPYQTPFPGPEDPPPLALVVFVALVVVTVAAPLLTVAAFCWFVVTVVFWLLRRVGDGFVSLSLRRMRKGL